MVGRFPLNQTLFLYISKSNSFPGKDENQTFFSSWWLKSSFSPFAIAKYFSFFSPYNDEPPSLRQLKWKYVSPSADNFFFVLATAETNILFIVLGWKTAILSKCWKSRTFIKKTGKIESLNYQKEYFFLYFRFILK